MIGRWRRECVPEVLKPGFRRATVNPHAVGESFRIASDELLSWNQIHLILAEGLNTSLVRSDTGRICSARDVATNGIDVRRLPGAVRPPDANGGGAHDDGTTPIPRH